jgi:hypothetical protein
MKTPRRENLVAEIGRRNVWMDALHGRYNQTKANEYSGQLMTSDGQLRLFTPCPTYARMGGLNQSGDAA